MDVGCFTYFYGPLKLTQFYLQSLLGMLYVYVVDKFNYCQEGCGFMSCCLGK